MLKIVFKTLKKRKNVTRIKTKKIILFGYTRMCVM